MEPPNDREEGRTPPTQGRRGFLRRAAAACAAGAAALAGHRVSRPQEGPVERELEEARFYTKHDLAG